jgi:hypothetical protein
MGNLITGCKETTNASGMVSVVNPQITFDYDSLNKNKPHIEKTHVTFRVKSNDGITSVVPEESEPFRSLAEKIYADGDESRNRTVITRIYIDLMKNPTGVPIEFSVTMNLCRHGDLKKAPQSKVLRYTVKPGTHPGRCIDLYKHKFSTEVVKEWAGMEYDRSFNVPLGDDTEPPILMKANHDNYKSFKDPSLFPWVYTRCSKRFKDKLGSKADQYDHNLWKKPDSPGLLYLHINTYRAFCHFVNRTAFSSIQYTDLVSMEAKCLPPNNIDGLRNDGVDVIIHLVVELVTIPKTTSFRSVVQDLIDPK